jgi:hypothetical protein
MTNIILFRLSDDDSFWIADLDAGTVERTDSFDLDDFGTAPRAEGVDIAVAATARSEAASHNFYRDGVDLAVAATTRSDAASHHMYRDGA